MVKEDTGTAEHVICLAVLLDDPVAVQFGYRVRTIRMERCGLGLRHLLYLTVEFGSRGLIYLTGFLQMVRTNGLQNTQYTYGIDVGRELRGIERHLHMTLRSEVVNLIRLHFAYQLHQRHRVTHVGIMQMKMRRALQMRYALAEVHRTTTNDTVYLVSFTQ